MTNAIKKALRSFGMFVIKASGWASLGQGWNNFSGSFRNTSAEKVNNQTSLTISSLYACIRNVSEDVGKMPIKLYRKDGDSRFEVTGNSVARLLQFQSNPEMDAMSFRETLNAHAMGWGNAYAEIQRDLTGTPVALWPLRPDRVKVLRERESHRIFYRVTTADGRVSDIFAKDIFHLHGMGFDGVIGYNIVQLASQTIGGALAMDKFAGSYFANGMHQSGNIKHPQTLSEDAQKRLKKQLDADFNGASQAHQTLILEEGMEFIPNKIDPKASQMIETRRFSVTEFCRWMRIPPHKVADLTKSSFNNIEEQNIDYVQDGITGWCKRWELEIWMKLLSPVQQADGLFFEHNVEGLLRGNIKGRSEAYKIFWDRGILSINEIRAKENLNPTSGGDTHFVPMNFIPLADAGNHQQLNSAASAISQRIADREIKELDKRVKHAAADIGKFRAWLDEFYTKHDAFIAQAINPICGDFLGHIDLLSLKPFMKTASEPVAVLQDRRKTHAEYIAKNLRGYYETRKSTV